MVFIIIGLTLLVIYPFIISIITSAIVAYIFYPVFIKINHKVKDRKSLASFLTVLLITLLILLPIIAIINGLTSQAKDAYSVIVAGSDGEYMTRFTTLFQEKLGVDINFGDIFSDFASYIRTLAKDFLTSIPNKALQISLFFFLLFYFFKEGPKLLGIVRELLPLKEYNKKKIMDKVDELTKAIVFGSLITAIVQGTIGGIGFLIFGIDSAMFWGFVMAIFALIPFIGTAIVWLPAALFLIFQGITQQVPFLWAKGIGLIIYGVFGISLVDNFFKPYIIGDSSHLHPALVLIGILGGLSLMGFIGIIIGPVIMVLFLSLLELYRSELKIEGKNK